MYVRERKPSSLDQLLDLIMTYFRAHHLDESTREPEENFTPMKNVSKQMTSHAHSGANVSTKTTTPAKTESSNPSGGDAARNSNNYNRDSRSHTNGAQTYRYPRKDIKDIQCHNCKQMGHYSWQCVKVNVVALPGCDNQAKPPVMKRGKIGKTDHLCGVWTPGLHHRGSSATRLPGWTSSACEGSNASRRKDLCYSSVQCRSGRQEDTDALTQTSITILYYSGPEWLRVTCSSDGSTGEQQGTATPPKQRW